MTDPQTRQQQYRQRKRRRSVMISIEVGPVELEALRRLDLLRAESSDKVALVEAVQRFLACAPAIAAIPERLYPR